MHSNRLLLYVVVVMVFVVVYTHFDPSLYSFFPECPLYKLTGFYCAGCGSQRALHALLTGDIRSAISYNLMLVIYLPFIITYYAVQLVNYLTKKRLFEIKIVHKPWFITLTALLIIAFGILRNLHDGLGYMLAPHTN